ncbi:cysteine synthase B (O-acetylserine sulfhydrolase B) [Lentisphaera araneosa HTCC2155]|jgi:S-sulfo-L-cysteine synthase (O-acetyl-L-serine-dependent)|uniref:Cysteine synthase n=1 Tax=Lentisphaera araneosa HTCC2155 TaxID=313628 RepID=A6DGY6_9BACT|nr:cysteine synthase CysM [Lentisphaera araneosa]EDM28869.1 cysteine synthase B (O-acetylserine sulfhydrolase B) [Lentisphaera araneosa HTCC2155]
MDFTDLIGKTPLLELKNLSPNKKVKVFAKLEGNNPGGSVKDRAAFYMISDAEMQGTLKPGMKIIEATSGNTGIALSMIASVKGYEIELAMPENSTQERVDAMKAFGAKVTLTESMETAIDYAKSKVEEGGYVMLNQFGNKANPEAHYRGTAPEIWAATQGQVTHFVSSMGTTGTIMGTSRYLKERNPNIQIVGCQPADGAKIPGIRRWPKEYLPTIYEEDRVDKIYDIRQEDAEEMMRQLGRQEGVFCGISSGGSVWAAIELAKTLEEGLIVAIVCDRGDRYLSTGLFGQ